ncbi:unnamed protein product [marine sediment metagenome]|uniref:Uncharacterized protein n=1 Tax=marine sediment metagenome TaxID=412755 RepID=X1JUA1_9ZZZZ
MPGMDEGRIVEKRSKYECGPLDLTVDDTTTCGNEIICRRHDMFLLSYDITETGTLVDGDRVRFIIQFREPDGVWHDYYNGPFGALYEEESTTPCSICVSGLCLGRRIRLCVVTDYTNATPASNYFTVTARITLVESG